MGEVVNRARDAIDDMQLLEPVKQDPAADPQHRRGADAGQCVSSFGTTCTSASPIARVLRRALPAMCRPMSSSFTISATTP